MPVEFTSDAQGEIEKLTPEEQEQLAGILEAELAAIQRALGRRLGPGSAAAILGDVLRLRGCVVLVVVSVQPPAGPQS